MLYDEKNSEGNCPPITVFSEWTISFWIYKAKYLIAFVYKAKKSLLWHEYKAMSITIPLWIVFFVKRVGNPKKHVFSKTFLKKRKKKHCVFFYFFRNFLEHKFFSAYHLLILMIHKITVISNDFNLLCSIEKFWKNRFSKKKS